MDVIKVPCVIERPLGDNGTEPTMYQAIWRDKFGFITTTFCSDRGLAEEKIAPQVQNFPTIVTLCGSTKFKEDFERVNRELTLEGKIVISVGCFGHAGDVFTDEQKEMLDEVHKRKIDLADVVYVINKGDYIGSSTRNEIDYALRHGKRIVYMEEHR